LLLCAHDQSAENVLLLAELCHLELQTLLLSVRNGLVTSL